MIRVCLQFKSVWVISYVEGVYFLAHSQGCLGLEYFLPLQKQTIFKNNKLINCKFQNTIFLNTKQQKQADGALLEQQNNQECEQKKSQSYIRYTEIISMSQHSNHKDNKQQNTQINTISTSTAPHNTGIQTIRTNESHMVKNQVDDFKDSHHELQNYGCKKQLSQGGDHSSNKIGCQKEEICGTNPQQKKVQLKKEQSEPKQVNSQKVSQDPNSRNIGQNLNQNRVFRKGDIIINQKKQIQYKAIELIGAGTFGQVLSVLSLMRNSQGGVSQHLMALKVIKNQPAYTSQGLMEIKNLREITKYEQLLKQGNKNYLQLYDGFMWQGHLCIAMELLDNNILNILETSAYKGIEMKWIEKWTKELLMCLTKIHKLGIIHCDIKPENIMFRPQQPDKPILIDFSSSCSNGSQMFTYIQSRFYRSPEVLLATKPYTEKVDMWSLGCVLAEMYLGLPIFPGGSAYDQVSKIFKVLQSMQYAMQVETFNQETIDMIRNSQSGQCYFWVNQAPISICEVPKEEQEPIQQSFNRSEITDFCGNAKQTSTKFEVKLKTYKQFKEAKIEKVHINQDYFNLDSLDDMISIRNPSAKDMQVHELFVDLVKKMLVFNPSQRISAEEAFLHPFVGGIYAELETIRNLEDLLDQGGSKLETKS